MNENARNVLNFVACLFDESPSDTKKFSLTSPFNICTIETLSMLEAPS